MYRTVTFYDVTFQILPLAIAIQCRGPTTPQAPCDVCGLGCSPFARHYWGNHILFSLPGGTKMFQFPPLASPLTVVMTVLQTDGLSHSEIRGSQVICTSPRLIAAYHVLRRLHEPRHPPCALDYFLGRRHAEKRHDSHTFSCVPQTSGNTFTLSFTLQFRVSICQRSLFLYLKENVENIGLEPMTSCMPCKRSSQLS